MYATTEDLTRLALPAVALVDVELPDQEAAIAAASDLADGYLASRYSLPLSGWGDDLRRQVCAIASYDIMTRRGYAPEGSDDQLRQRYEDAIRWLERVADGRIKPAVTDASPSDASSAGLSGPIARSASKRGW